MVVFWQVNTAKQIKNKKMPTLEDYLLEAVVLVLHISISFEVRQTPDPKHCFSSDRGSHRLGDLQITMGRRAVET